MNIKEHSSQDVNDALSKTVHLIEYLTSDELTPEAAERGHEVQLLIDAARKVYIETAIELLTPFAFMASAYKDKPDWHIVAQVKNQSITVGSLRMAKTFVDELKNGLKETD